MSDLSPVLRPALPRTAEPYRVAVRRLRWLRAALRDQLAALTAETGVAFAVDDRRLAAVFVSWIRRVEAQRPKAAADRRAFFDFAAGLMLEELLTREPVRAGPLPPDLPPGHPARAWPEGFACAVFCINMRAAVMAQEFDAPTEVAPLFFDPRTWASFRENLLESAASAVGFLDLFVGGQPDWAAPALFRAGAERRLGLGAPQGPDGQP